MLRSSCTALLLAGALALAVGCGDDGPAKSEPAEASTRETATSGSGASAPRTTARPQVVYYQLSKG